MRVSVSSIVDLVASGCTVDDILHDFPYLEAADISQALAYAARLVREQG
jgi:uncharacterized protein (DUF433 family)